MKRIILLALSLVLCGCLQPIGDAPTTHKPSPKPGPASGNELQACYYEAIADGVEKGWFASANEVVSRAKVAREKLGLQPGGDKVSEIELLKNPSVKPLTEAERKTLAEQLRKVAQGVR
mgnify:CR=1 FL=1